MCACVSAMACNLSPDLSRASTISSVASPGSMQTARRGICKVRFNEAGRLLVPAGYVAALACDPTEKKPFFHLLPGSDTLTFGMLGCDLHCGYCQNWVTSQALRDEAAGSAPNMVTAERLVEM